MVEEAIEESGDGGGVAEELAPILDGAIGGEDVRRPLVEDKENKCRSLP
jgi:hypothetical protein